MKNLVNNTKSILTLPQKTILQVGDNNVADKIVEELQKHPTVAKMIKDKQIEVKAAAEPKTEKKAPAKKEDAKGKKEEK